MTGNVRINSNANRLSQFYVWNYGPGNDSYYKYMYVDFAESRDKVCPGSFLIDKNVSISLHEQLIKSVQNNNRHRRMQGVQWVRVQPQSEK